MHMFTHTKTKTKKGFTLIELLVVISIIGLLSTLAVVALNNARIRARDTKRLADADAIYKAMQLYFDQTGSYTGACKGSSGAPIINLPVQINACVGSTTNPTIGLHTFIPGIGQLADPVGTGNCRNPATGLCNYTLNDLRATDFVINFWSEGGDGAYIITQNGVLKDVSRQ